MPPRERPERGFEEPDEGSPVIMPDESLADSSSEECWEPGIIEVVLRCAIPPEKLVDAANAPLNGQPSNEAELIGLSGVLRRYGLKDAVFSFESLDDVEASAELSRENHITLSFSEDQDVAQIAKDLTQLEVVERATPIPIAVPPSTPKNEPFIGEQTERVVFNPHTGFDNQWYLFRTHTDRAWKLGASGAGVVIADIDFGFLDTHEELEHRIELKHNSFDDSDTVSHGNKISHGTAVLGLAGAADNDLGIIGFAFGASLWAIQANTGKGPRPPCNTWARAIDYVRDADSGGRRKVIMLEVQTCRLGNYEMVPSVNKAIRDAIAGGVVVCVAAGNGNRDVCIDDLNETIPLTGSILVGATIDHVSGNKRAGFSNFGDRVAVSAPGDLNHDLTCSSCPSNKYMRGFGGTSGATPKVAGAIALMLEKNPALSHHDVKDILVATGAEVVTAADKPVGKFLDVGVAVREAVNRRGNH